jgi:hypothetical protein
MNERNEISFEVNTEVFKNGSINLEITSQSSSIRGDIFRQVLNTQEEQIRQALIKLGWTPPELHKSIQDADRYRWLKENGNAHSKRVSKASLDNDTGLKSLFSFSYWCENLDEAIDKAMKAK